MEVTQFLYSEINELCYGHWVVVFVVEGREKPKWCTNPSNHQKIFQHDPTANRLTGKDRSVEFMF